MNPCLFMLVLLATGAIVSQPVQPDMRPVEAGIDDTSPVAVSQREQRYDQRIATGFDRVYEIVSPSGERSFVRVNGAVYAQFDQAWYSDSGDALVPPGTRFTIGAPPSSESIAQTPVRAPNAVSLRADAQPARQGSPPPAAARAYPVGEPSIVGNEWYRRVRITQLLRSTLNS